MAEQAVVDLVARLGGVDVATADRASLTDVVDGLRRVRAWADALEGRVARRLEEVAAFPEQILAAAARGSLRDAEGVTRRAATLTELPPFAAALAAGALTAGHVDAIGRGLRQLEPSVRPQLVAQAERLVAEAADASVEDFARTVRQAVRRLQTDDGIARQERQRRATRLRTWVDRDDGMWCLSGRFDPETGVRLHGRLQAMVDTLFAEQVPDGCPTDPGEQQDFLRALALLALSEGRGGVGRPEIVVVVDTTAVDGPVVDWGLPVEIPARVLAELADSARMHTVVVRNGVVLHAPGQLDLGRTTRVASRAQRRALRGLYATCAVPGCAVRFDGCKLHHVVWWEHGGTSDLRNYLPLCERHHHAVHDRGWVLQLGPDRELSIRLPDGQVMSTGPPNRSAA